MKGKYLLIFMLSSMGVAHAAALGDLDFSAYVDTSYNYLANNHRFISGIQNRLNDLTQNGFTLQQMAMTASKRPEVGFGGLFNMVVGRDPYTLAPYGWDPYYGSDMLGMVVPNAYLQYADHSFTLIGGIFESYAGYENLDPNKDVEFSRSILDGFAEPGIFLGVRGFYVASDALTLNVGVNNGWSGLRDWGRGKTVEFGAGYHVTPKLNFIAQAVTGKQRLIVQTVRGPLGWRNFLNLVATYAFSDKIDFALTGDYAMQTKALTPSLEITHVNWQGIGAYMNYHWTDKWLTALRGEWFGDAYGYKTGVRQNWREATATLSYKYSKQLLMRIDVRRDISNKKAFISNTGPGLSFYQGSVGAEVLYNFV